MCASAGPEPRRSVGQDTSALALISLSYAAPACARAAGQVPRGRSLNSARRQQPRDQGVLSGAVAVRHDLLADDRRTRRQRAGTEALTSSHDQLTERCNHRGAPAARKRWCQSGARICFVISRTTRIKSQSAGAAEQSAVFQILSIAQAGNCSHDTVAPTVDRTRRGGSLQAIIYWRGTGSSNPSPSAAESVLSRLALRL